MSEIVPQVANCRGVVDIQHALARVQPMACPLCARLLTTCCVARGNKDWKVEVFLQGELVVNITRHELVPTHKVMTEDEKKGLLKR